MNFFDAEITLKVVINEAAEAKAKEIGRASCRERE